MRPIYRPAKYRSTAVTRCEVAPGDNWMILLLWKQCQAGDIPVVAPTSPCEDGYFGDLTSHSLQARESSAWTVRRGRDVLTLVEDFRFGQRRSQLRYGRGPWQCNTHSCVLEPWPSADLITATMMGLWWSDRMKPRFWRKSRLAIEEDKRSNCRERCWPWIFIRCVSAWREGLKYVRILGANDGRPQFLPA